MARPSRATRCTATPTGPLRSAAVSAIDRVDDESGAAILVDERGDVGHARQRRVGASFVGAQRGDRRPDLVEARPADRLGVEQRPLGLGEVPAQHVPGAGDVQQHRRQRVPGEVVQLAGDASPLLGHLLVGERPTGLLQLLDQPLLAVHGPPEGQGEHVGESPTAPT